MIDIKDFSELFLFQKKSEYKAGEGSAMGLYPFYTSSTELSKRLDTFLFDIPCLIFGTGGQASVHYCDEKFSVSTDCLVAHVKKPAEVYLKYIFYYLSGNIRILEKGFKGAGLKHISKEYISQLKIPLPPLETQKMIAAILDKADELRQNDKKILEKYDQLAQSVFLEMFGDPVSNKKRWHEIQLNEICISKDDIKCGPFGTQLQKNEYKREGVPLWGITQINSNFKISTAEFISPGKADELKQYRIEPFDIVMSRKGNVGKCAIYPKFFSPGIMHSDVLRIRCDKKIINPIFLSCQFKWSRSLNTQIDNVSSGAIMAGINVAKLKNIIIQLPPISLQNQFAKIIESIDNQKHITQISLQKSEDLFLSLLQRAFKGELE